ncbi:flagellar protein FlhE [Kineococcus sp. NBC_00420]|uniref:flagellar protein FlhE n=1 Tax=Kineococcus sp. NBC_00420 TaxID=2903564 RepID=UPI002E1FBE74
MKIKTALRTAAAAALAVGTLTGLAMPAQAAGNYSGAGSPLTLTTYGASRTGFGPSAPSTVPATSTITGVSYSISYSRPSFAPGSLSSQICYTGFGCTAASYPSGSTTAFNGLAANKDLYFKFIWSGGSGTIKGGVNVTDSITVDYS